MEKDSPLYNTLIQSIIDNMNLSNREELIAAMQQASQPNPEAQQMAQAAQQAQLEFQQSQTAALSSQAAESQSRAQKMAMETQLMPSELEIDRIKAVTTNIRKGTEDDKEFERRLKVADMLLKERQIDMQKSSQSAKEIKEKESSELEKQLMSRLTSNGR